jgi:hypothetical protein
MIKRYLRVRLVATGKEVHKVKVTNPTQRKVEKVMSGMLMNMSDKYFIDDSDFDDIE